MPENLSLRYQSKVESEKSPEFRESLTIGAQILQQIRNKNLAAGLNQKKISEGLGYGSIEDGDNNLANDPSYFGLPITPQLLDLVLQELDLFEQKGQIDYQTASGYFSLVQTALEYQTREETRNPAVLERAILLLARLKSYIGLSYSLESYFRLFNFFDSNPCFGTAFDLWADYPTIDIGIDFTNRSNNRETAETLNKLLELVKFAESLDVSLLHFGYGVQKEILDKFKSKVEELNFDGEVKEFLDGFWGKEYISLIDFLENKLFGKNPKSNYKKENGLFETRASDLNILNMYLNSNFPFGDSGPEGEFYQLRIIENYPSLKDYLPFVKDIRDLMDRHEIKRQAFLGGVNYFIDKQNNPKTEEEKTSSRHFNQITEVESLQKEMQQPDFLKRYKIEDFPLKQIKALVSEIAGSGQDLITLKKSLEMKLQTELIDYGEYKARLDHQQNLPLLRLQQLNNLWQKNVVEMSQEQIEDQKAMQDIIDYIYFVVEENIDQTVLTKIALDGLALIPIIIENGEIKSEILKREIQRQFLEKGLDFDKLKPILAQTPLIVGFTVLDTGHKFENDLYQVFEDIFTENLEKKDYLMILSNLGRLNLLVVPEINGVTFNISAAPLEHGDKDYNLNWRDWNAFEKGDIYTQYDPKYTIKYKNKKTSETINLSPFGEYETGLKNTELNQKDFIKTITDLTHPSLNYDNFSKTVQEYQQKVEIPIQKPKSEVVLKNIQEVSEQTSKLLSDSPDTLKNQMQRKFGDLSFDSTSLRSKSPEAKNAKPLMQIENTNFSANVVNYNSSTLVLGSEEIKLTQILNKDLSSFKPLKVIEVEKNTQSLTLIIPAGGNFLALPNDNLSPIGYELILPKNAENISLEANKFCLKVENSNSHPVVAKIAFETKTADDKIQSLDSKKPLQTEVLKQTLQTFTQQQQFSTQLKKGLEAKLATETNSEKKQRIETFLTGLEKLKYAILTTPEKINQLERLVQQLKIKYNGLNQSWSDDGLENLTDRLWQILTKQKGICSDACRLFAFGMGYLGIPSNLQSVYQPGNPKLITTNDAHQRLEYYTPQIENNQLVGWQSNFHNPVELFQTSRESGSGFGNGESYSNQNFKPEKESDLLEFIGNQLSQIETSKPLEFKNQKLDKAALKKQKEEQEKQKEVNELKLFQLKWQTFLEKQLNQNPEKTKQLLALLHEIFNARYNGSLQIGVNAELVALISFPQRVNFLSQNESLDSLKNSPIKNLVNLPLNPGNTHVVNYLQELYANKLPYTSILNPEFTRFSPAKKLQFIAKFWQSKTSRESEPSLPEPAELENCLTLLNELQQFLTDFRGF